MGLIIDCVKFHNISIRAEIRFWSGFGPVLVRFWSGSGPVLVQFGSGSGPVLARVCFEFILGMVEIFSGLLSGTGSNQVGFFGTGNRMGKC